MGIFSRTRDIFAANFTELLDRAEDPARMIRMIILEMEETLVEVRASAARSIADSKEMKRALSAAAGAAVELDREGRAGAFSKDREDLAKAALIERREGRRHGRRPRSSSSKSIEDTLKGYEADIAKLQGKLREARARQNADRHSHRKRGNPRPDARKCSTASRTEDAFSRFDQLERRADFAEGTCRRSGNDRDRRAWKKKLPSFAQPTRSMPSWKR